MQSPNPAAPSTHGRGSVSPRTPVASGTTTTVVIEQQREQDGEQTSTTQPEQLVMRLETPEDARPRVQWSTDTVDNEHMGKKKSKCCCIYKRKRNWDESDSSDGECESEHCRGHVEKGGDGKRPPEGDGGGGDGHPGPSVPS